MPAPEQVFVAECPPGLEYLLQIDRFMVSLKGNHITEHDGVAIMNQFY